MNEIDIKRTLFDILFSSELKGSERTAKVYSTFGNPTKYRNSVIKINDSSINFFGLYLQKILDEFTFIKKLEWCKYLDIYEEGDTYGDLRLDIAINDIRFEVVVDGSVFESNHHFHPQGYDPLKIRSTLSKNNNREYQNRSNEWLRFLDGFILFNNLGFHFLKRNEVAFNTPLFQFEEEEDWVLEQELIGFDELTEFKVTRTDHAFLCVSKDFIPEDPLPSK